MGKNKSNEFLFYSLFIHFEFGIGLSFLFTSGWGTLTEDEWSESGMLQYIAIYWRSRALDTKHLQAYGMLI